MLKPGGLIGDPYSPVDALLRSQQFAESDDSSKIEKLFCSCEHCDWSDEIRYGSGHRQNAILDARRRHEAETNGCEGEVLYY